MGLKQPELQAIDKRLAIRERFLRQTLEPTKDEIIQAVGDDTEKAKEEETSGIYNREMEMHAEELQRVLLAREEIRQGIYGICKECDGEISKARLQTLGAVDFCINCQREFEKTGYSSFDPDTAFKNPDED